MSQDRELEESFQALVEESREQLGEPPSSRELLAYHRDQLSVEDAERVRQHLAREPATRDRFLDLTAHVPGPDGPGHLTDEDVAEDWEVIQRRLRLEPQSVETEAEPKAPVVAFPASRWRHVERFVAVAAVLAMVVLGVQTFELSQRLSAPRLDEASVRLLPDGTRGGEPPIQVRVGEAGVHLELAVFDLAPFDSYRLAIQDLGKSEDMAPRWTGEISRQSGDVFRISLPANFLPQGEYVFRLYGVGEEEVLLASYRVRLVR